MAQSKFALDLRGVLLADVVLDESASCEIRAMVGGGSDAAEHDAVVAGDPLQRSRMGEVRADFCARGKCARLEFLRVRGTTGRARTLGAMKLDLVGSVLKQ